LVGRGIPISVVASDAREPTLRSRHAQQAFVIASPSDSARAVSDLERLARKFDDPPVLYYGNDATLLLVSRMRDKLAGWFRFSVPDPDLVEILVDKSRFAELARQRGLNVPTSISSAEVDGASDLIARVGLPCAFKPNVHTNWLSRRASIDHVPKKALRADTAVEALRLYDELSRFGPFVAQRWIEGGEDAVLSFHCYAGEQSRVLGWFVGRKIRTFPKEAGISTYLELAEEPSVATAGFEIVSKLGIVGPLKIDFKRDARTGELYLLELNPRFTLWCYLGAAAGVNLPAIAYAALTGTAPPDQKPYRTDVRWLSFGNDWRTFWRCYRPSGELGVVEWLLSYRGPKVYEVFSWSDSAPSIAKALDYMRRAAARISSRRPLAVAS
jgi:predicted ATP-grasp superfamily ATP-dependent carboligase